MMLTDTPFVLDESTLSILESLDALPNTRLRVYTLAQHFTRLGRGSGRSVFELDEDYVLKVARNKKGIAQNRHEWQVCSQQEPEDFLAHVVQAYPDGLWIIQQRLEPVNVDEFEAYLGHDLSSFFYAVRFGSPQWKNPFFLKLSRFISSFDLDPFDLADESSWGMRNGVPVVCDFGLSKAIARKLYEVSY